MLASTCRALWTLDLPSVFVGKQSSAQGMVAGKAGRVAAYTGVFAYCPRPALPLCAELHWAAKRWSRAQRMEIYLSDGNVKLLSEAWACSPPNALSRLSLVCLLLLAFVVPVPS